MFFGGVAGGLSAGTTGAALGAASPLAIRVTQAAVRRIHDVRDIAIAHSGLSLEEIAAWAETTDPRADFFLRLLEAARRAGLEEKRQALGRVAARALTDDAALDECVLFLEAIDRLESPHIRVLTAMAAPRPGRGQLEGHPVTGVIDWEEIRETVRDSPGSLRSAIATLQSFGAVMDSSPATYDQVAGKERWIVSEFGAGLLGFLVNEEVD